MEGYIKMDLKYKWCGLDSAGSRQSPVAGYCEDGKKTLSSIKGIA
jgi:hypothetical protein